MKRNFFALGGIVVLLLSLLMVSTLVSATPPGPNYMPVDVGPRLRGMAPSDVALHLNGFDGSYTGGATSSSTVPECYGLGDIVPGLWYDDMSGGLYFSPYVVRAIGKHIEVWVMQDLNFPTNDPRNPVVVTDEQIAYLVDQFDNNIYPNSTSFFGMPDFHDGSNSPLTAEYGIDYYDPEGRTIVMISNIGDENYYDPTYPLYIAGFYWGLFEYYLDRNVISIDAYDWANRVGPDAAPPFMYEGVFAHEFQHLIHDDLDSDEEIWVNEGCSDFAIFLNGYGHPSSHVFGNYSAATLPENSLVVWGDQGGLEILSDYGHAYLWTLYLFEQLGGSFIQNMVCNPDNGISGINSTLSAFKIKKDFGELYHDWAVALLIDSKKPEGGRYQFKNIDFNLNIGPPDNPNPEAFNTPGAPPWGTDYIWIDGDPKDLDKITFNGIDYTLLPTDWSSVYGFLRSSDGNEIDNWAIFESVGGGTLTFDTWYDIEKEWDFGFVQVSTDGGHTWTSLANGYTKDKPIEGSYPKVIENLPGLTGYSGGWISMSFDLSTYAGQDILIAFRYVTDWASFGYGWFIDNVRVDGTLISDCSNTEAFKDITEILPINNNFTVTFVGIKEKKSGNEYKVKSMKLDNVTEEGMFELKKILDSSTSAVMLVTFDAPQGFTGYADYTYDFTYKNKGHKK